MDLKLLGYGLLALLLVGLGGYGAGRYMTPAKIQVKTEIITKEVEVTKKDVKIIEHEIKRPDGTIDKTTTTEDKTVVSDSRDSKSKASEVVVGVKPQWKVQALTTFKPTSFSYLYGISVERRILGPVFVGVHANTDKNVGISLSFEF